MVLLEMCHWEQALKFPKTLSIPSVLSRGYGSRCEPFKVVSSLRPWES